MRLGVEEMTYLAAIGRPWGREAVRRVASRLPRGTAFGWCASAQMLQLNMTLQTYRYVFFLNWSDKVLPEMLALSECVNFHCTDLPYGRGGAPIENLILRGHTETVITAHRMTDEIDAGPIYGKSGPISLAGTKDEILARFVEPVADLMTWMMEHEPGPTPQIVIGDVVPFRRLPPAEAEALWATRSHV